MEGQTNDTPTQEPLVSPASTKFSVIRELFKKKLLRTGVGGVLAVLLLVGLGWWGWSNSSLSKLGVEAALIEGKVQYRLDHDQAWENAQEGMSFGEGAHIRTLAESRAVLNIDDGSAVRLNSNSSVILTKLAVKHIVIENTGGDVYTRVVKSSKRVFQVRSGSTTYQSLGTAYRTFQMDDKKGVEVYHSKVNILGIKAGSTILVEQGKRYYTVNKTATELAGKVTELSLAELSNDEFVKWNSEQDKKDFEKDLGVLFDLNAPTLEITAPSAGSTTSEASVELKGTTELGAKILVNGSEVTNSEGQFTTTVALNEGANTIKIEAIDQAGNKTVKELSVTRATPPPPAPTTSFKLTGTKTDKGISFTWTISGISAPKGFKLVKSTSANPTYSSKSDYVYVESSSSRSYTWKIQDGKTYHFRICAYNGETCTPYSNDITVTAPSKPASEEPTGTLTLNHTGGSNVSWTLNGSAPHGFKLVWSGSSNPTYPGSSAQFYDKSATSGSITNNSGYYYVRICMYHDGACKNYSNELYILVP